MKTFRRIEAALEKWLLRLFLTRCSRCGARAVQSRQSHIVRLVNDRGQPCCVSLTYASCDGCGDRTRRWGKKPVETPSEQEWRENVTDPESRASG